MNGKGATLIKWGSYAGSISAILGLFVFMGFVPVWADEFQQHTQEFNGYRLEQCQDQLRDIKIKLYYLQDEGKTPPQFLLDEKLILEDKIKDLEREIETDDN